MYQTIMTRQKHKKKWFRISLFLLLLFVCIRFITGFLDSRVCEGDGNIPFYLQTDPKWADKPYGDGTMEENGCGPTCLSMVYCGLTGDDRWDPYTLAKRADREGYYIAGSGTAWSMMVELAQQLGLTVKHISYDENAIRQALQSGTPIICSMRPGDFTTTGHFIVLAGIREDGNILIRDPNSRHNSRKAWKLERLMPQIKNLWGYAF